MAEYRDATALRSGCRRLSGGMACRQARFRQGGFRDSPGMPYICLRYVYADHHSFPKDIMTRSRRIYGLLLVALLLALLPTPDAIAQPGLQIRVLRRAIDSIRNEEVYLNGYARAVGGATIAYHSCHPDANSALLARARKGDNEISWLTDTIPDGIQGNYYFFVWIAGIEKEGFRNSSASYKFDLSINGERWFSFKNLKDDRARKWNVPGRDGARLSFEATWSDGPGDLFGYMTMKVPKEAFPAGKPLTVHVRGEESRSADWYMTFQYRFNFTPAFRVEPAILRGNAGPTQLVRVSLDNLLPRRTATIATGTGDTIRRDLRIGANMFDISMPMVQAPTTVPFTFFLDSVRVSAGDFFVTPVQQREVYLLPYSHNDIGYTDLQPNIERRQRQHLSQALKLIKETDGYPAEAQFKWNLEVLWPLESYLKTMSRRSQDDFFSLVSRGRIGLNGFYANVLTGLANAPEMSEYFRFARTLREEYQARISSAVISDIPGFSWGVVSAMAQSGIRYFLNGPNAGDRVGHVYEHLGDKPFYWLSPSGKDSILFFLAGASYSSFHESDLPTLGAEKIYSMLRIAEGRHYAYDMLILPYTIGGDNGPPDPELSDFVRSWNEKYQSPVLIISTVDAAMHEFESRYGSSLPSRRGDFTPYWEDGAYSSAAETILNRRSVDRMIQTNAIASLLPGAHVPDEKANDAWRNIVLFDEHTWGAHNSVSEPDDPMVKRMWTIKQQYALSGDTLSRAVLDSVLHPIARPIADQPCIAIVNTIPWTRTDLAIIPPELSKGGDRATDEHGAPLRSQRLTNGELAVLIQAIPAYSTRKVFLQQGAAMSKGSAKMNKRGLSTSLLNAELDPVLGTLTRVQSKKFKKQFSAPPGLNRYLYVPGKDADERQSLSNVAVAPKETGGLVASCLVSGTAPGCASFSTEVRVIDGVNRIEFINTFDKTAIRDKESVHFAFPFSIPDPTVRYDVATGIVRPEDDQIDGSCKNFVSTESFIDVSSAAAGVTLASPDVALMQIGDIQAERPWLKNIAHSSSVYSYVLNNYWHTNYKADQQGPVTVRYALQIHGAFAADDAVRFGREMREPLLVVPSSASIESVPPLLAASPSSFIIRSIAPVDSGRAWLMQVSNVSDRPASLSLHWRGGAELTIHRSDAWGAPVRKTTLPAAFDALETMYLRIEAN
jgi:alpha-mannosidase